MLTLSNVSVSFAQASTDTLNSVKYGFLPIVSFNSDVGFIGGLEIQRFDYRGVDLPFTSYGKYSVYYTSIGALTLSYAQDIVKTLGTDIRTKHDVTLIRNVGNYFTGIVGRNEFSLDRFNSSDYYNYQSLHVTAGLESRIPFFLGEHIQRNDTKIGVRYIYENPFEFDDVSYMNEFQPTGVNGSHTVMVETGIIIERRNSEFQARSGYNLTLLGKASIPMVSTFTFGAFDIGGVANIPILSHGDFNLTWATRLRYELTLGDVPYWFLPRIGGANLRGHIWNRQIGYGALSFATELRSWLVKLPFQNLKLGINGFIDGGNAHGRTINLTTNYLFSYGFGGVLSIFTPDYILKYDIGFSNESTGIYLGTGYSF